jgi:hypothetical protein
MIGRLVIYTNEIQSTINIIYSCIQQAQVKSDGIECSVSYSVNRHTSMNICVYGTEQYIASRYIYQSFLVDYEYH